MKLTSSPFAATSALLLAAFSALVPPALAATPFVHEAVVAVFQVGNFNSLALDTQGNSHLSYHDEISGDLEYARKNGGTWTFETVDAADFVGAYNSLALDASGNPHISYYDGTHGDLKYARKVGGTWIVEAVDATGFVGQYSSIALDAQDNPRISYRDFSNSSLKYASKSGGTWTLETVDAPGDVGWDTDIAIDGQGNPRICYLDVTSNDLKYASKFGGFWTVETVDNGNVGGFASLALDAQGNPRISYHEAIAQDLKFASKASGTAWTIETVDATGMVGRHTSLALDAQGNPRISYSDYTNFTIGDLKYASKSGSTWTTETVDATEGAMYYTSLALDAQGNPRISYGTGLGLQFTDAAVHVVSPAGGERWASGSLQTVRWSGAGTVDFQISSDGGLTYSTLLSGVTNRAVAIIVPNMTTDQARFRVSRASPYSTAESQGTFSIAPDLVSPWWTKIVDAPDDVGGDLSLALDAHSNPALSYYDGTNGDLKFASRTGGTWTLEAVDAAGFVGFSNSLALDHQGNPRIGYYDFPNGDLKYASKAGGVWSLEVVDAADDVGSDPSLALDAQGNPRIAYYDFTNFDLKYASKAGGVWTIETVDAAGMVGLYPSLAIDAAGNPRISYYSAAVPGLVYASKSGGFWSLETVDAVDAGLYSAIALDASGNPRIAYNDQTNVDLKYASRSGGAWTLETVDAAGFVGAFPSLALDAAGNPHISYFDNSNGDLKYARKSGGIWTRETVDDDGINSVGYNTSLALDAQGNPRIGYYDQSNGDLKYASAAIELAEPAPGTTWPVGASRTVTWDGTGRVDLSLSVDGGRTWDLLGTALTGEYRMIVPHAPTRFAQLKLERAVPRSVAATTGLFAIETSIALLSLTAQAAPAGASGVLVSWRTDPGPEDLSGYRLERADPSAAGGWRTIVALTRETSHLDAAGAAGSRYRLSAVNGLGETLRMGEAEMVPAQPLAAWPLPYRGGSLHVSFATFGGLGGGKGGAEVELYDLGGRKVRTLALGSFAAGQQRVTWDGCDDAGRTVGNGVYFLRARTGGTATTLKLAVVR